MNGLKTEGFQNVSGFLNASLYLNCVFLVWELLQIKIEFSFARWEGLKEYLSDFVNWFDLIGQILYLIFGINYWLDSPDLIDGLDKQMSAVAFYPTEQTIDNDWLYYLYIVAISLILLRGVITLFKLYD